jgi:lipopolysaccharide transport system ATP-binding protein
MSSDYTLQVSGISKDYYIFNNSSQILLSKIFKKIIYKKVISALRNITFILPKGHVLGVIGKNGAGKSTLLQIISGTLKQTSGTFTINGRVAALLELGSGLNPNYTGLENIDYITRLYNISDEKHVIPMIVQFADLGDFINEPVRTYSSGMRMRLAFAIVTSVSPDVLIIDEALSVGDKSFSLKSFNRIKDIRNSGASIIFCSHSLYQVESFCDTVMWLDNGSLKKIGDPHEVVSLYNDSQITETINVLDKHINDNSPRYVQLVDCHLFGYYEKSMGVYKFHSNSSNLRLSIDYKILDLSITAKPVIAVSIRNSNGEIITSFITNDSSISTKLSNNLTQYKLEIPSIPLLAGVYTIDINILNDEAVYRFDSVRNVFEIKVLQKDARQGYVYLPHRWY